MIMKPNYKFTYEAPPISEITKEQIISARSLLSATRVFFSDKAINTLVFKVELIDSDLE